MRSRSRTVSRRRRTLPASDTCDRGRMRAQLLDHRVDRRQRRPSSPRSPPALVGRRPPRAPSAASPRSSRRARRGRAGGPARPRPSGRRASSRRAASRSARPSSARSPGSRRNSTTPSGTLCLRFVSACISPSSTISTTFASIVLPISGRSVARPVERELGHGLGRLADPRRSAAVGEDPERLLAQDLRDVREQVELVGDLRVPGQRPGHPAMICRCLAPSSASRRTTSARTSRRWCEALGECSTPSGTRVLVIDDGSPDGTGEIADRLAREHAWVSVLHRETKEGIGPAYVAGFRRALAEGAELVLEMDCDFSHDPADVPRLIAAAEDADLVLGSRYVAGGGTENWGLLRRFVSRGGCLYAQVAPRRRACATSPAASSASAARRSRRSTSTRCRAHGYAFQIETTYRVLRAGLRVREVPIRFTERRAGASKMTGCDRRRGGVEGAAPPLARAHRQALSRGRGQRRLATGVPRCTRSPVDRRLLVDRGGRSLVRLRSSHDLARSADRRPHEVSMRALQLDDDVDDNADNPGFVLTRWYQDVDRTPLRVYGPQATEAFTRARSQRPLRARRLRLDRESRASRKPAGLREPSRQAGTPPTADRRGRDRRDVRARGGRLLRPCSRHGARRAVARVARLPDRRRRNSIVITGDTEPAEIVVAAGARRRHLVCTCGETDRRSRRTGLSWTA